MTFDFFVALLLVGAFVTGYKNGFIKTVLRAILFIAGGVAALHFMISRDQSGWLIAALIAGAYTGALIGTWIAKALRLSIIRGPLRWLDSLTGSLLEITKYVVFFYIIGTILLWAPWPTGQNQISESKFYLQVSKHAPALLDNLQKEVEKLLDKNLGA